ncbi:MAG: Flp pilus assembly protein CpaB [Alphaproteobacteria bacterium]|nr:Flp pilus assembly protein CpaB [Alphaproteobacteria bacterium]
MSVQRIVILAVALLAALGALLLVRNASGSAPAATPTAVEGPMVLIAAKDIPAGVAAQADMLTWTNWPANGVNGAFITQAADPKALETYTGAVARLDIQAGEPITARRLVKRGDQGLFAATIRPGYRAIALPITPETAAANFIGPGDRVDVILARKIESADGRGPGEARSDVILENVRVLSFGSEIRPADGEPKPSEGTVATLELSPRDAETFALARKIGDITLALRAIEPSDGRLDSARRPGVRALDQGIQDAGGVRIHAFGRVETAAAASSGAPR